MARTMLMDSKSTDMFWTQAMQTTMHIHNRVMLRNNTDKNPYELWIQSSVSLSTAEAEYIAATSCCTQVLWMKQTLTDIQVEYDEPIPIYCDNTSAISISKNPVMHSKTKHIPIKYHFLRE
jgi:hypothetical protein